MIVSKNLITKFLPEFKKVSDSEFINACNTVGIEVEKIIKHPKLENFIIGEIIQIDKHPNADRLHVCKIKIDQTDQYLTIVCGGKNLELNKKVIVAQNNTTLYNDKIIKHSELRGVLSQGMICSYNELTPHHNFLPSNEEHFVITLDEASIGDIDVSKYVGLDDVIYDLSLPSNRNDLNSVYVLCKELSGYFKYEFEMPNINIIDEINANNIQLSIDHNVASSVSFLKVNEVKISSSSWIIKGLLMNNNIIPLNNVLDKIAYITLLTNIPMAVYDANKISDNFYIGLDSQSHKVICFDNVERTTNNEDILIKSNNEVISIAGCIGSKAFGIDNNTTSIVIEVCNFNFINIRNTAKRLNISSDASKRFSKPMSSYLTLLAIDLLKQGFSNIEYLKINCEDIIVTKFEIDWSYVSSLLGMELKQGMVAKYLKYFGILIENNICIVPKYRLDIKTNQDLVEEIIKIFDINEIPTLPIYETLGNKYDNESHNLINKLKQCLISNNFNEVKTYNLTNKNNLDKFNVFNYTKFIAIKESNNVDRSFLRTNLIERMLKTYQFNLSYKNELLPIFEIQKIYSSQTYTNLTILLPNKIYFDRLSKSQININLNWLRAICDQIGVIFNTKFDYFALTGASDIFYNNDVLSIKFGGHNIGYLGALKTSNLKQYDLDNKTIYCLSINLNMLLDTYQKTNTTFTSISKLMPIVKDISFFVNASINIIHVLQALEELSFVQNYEFIDHYLKDDGQISYTVRFNFINTQNLETKEIDQYLNQVIRVLNEHGCVIRK